MHFKELRGQKIKVLRNYTSGSRNAFQLNFVFQNLLIKFQLLKHDKLFVSCQVNFNKIFFAATREFLLNL